MYILQVPQIPFSQHRAYHYGDFPSPAELVARKLRTGCAISVIIPAVDEAETIGEIVSCIRRTCMEQVCLVDDLVVIDGGSRDDTVERATRCGALVYPIKSSESWYTIPSGKGSALWTGLQKTRGDLVICVDADIRNFSERFIFGLIGPLLLEKQIQLVKACYQRPLVLDGVQHNHQGGRVTELLVRPMLSAFYPQVARLRQPLSGEYAMRRGLAHQLSFFSSYGVEVGLLIDTFRIAGAEAVAEVDLDSRIHRNRDLGQLGCMSFGILHALLKLLERDGHIQTLSPAVREALFPRNGGWEECVINEELLPPLAEVLP